MKVWAFLTIGVAILASVKAEEPTGRQVNQNSVALIQALMNLPEPLIGGVALEDRGAFLNLISHYGDIDFANGYFEMGGDGARAYDKPSARFFQIRIILRDKQLPMCLIAQQPGVTPSLSVIEFKPYWRWEDVTEQVVPENLEQNSLGFRLSRDNHHAIAFRTTTVTVEETEYVRSGPMVGRVEWTEDRLSFFPFDHAEFFRSAIREVPPKYFADIPLEQRALLLKQVESDGERFDATGGWLHYFSDGRDISASSMIWAKLLRRTKGKPYLLVHMAKPFTGKQPPSENQTFVLRRDGEDWVETNTLQRWEFMLKGHFRPRRDNIVEVGSWKEVDRSDGRGKTWTYGSRELDLRWGYQFFNEIKPESEFFSKN